MDILKCAPPVAARKETVEVPEWGGAVVVRGLLASEAFAVLVMRQSALRRARAEAHAENEQVIDFSDLTFDELRQFGTYVPQLLAMAVVNGEGIGLYTADDWEVVAQCHPGVYARLHAVAERLSGMNVEAVAKNSPQSPS